MIRSLLSTIDDVGNPYRMPGNSFAGDPPTFVTLALGLFLLVVMSIRKGKR